MYETMMSKGEILVCVTKNFTHFTYGKSYKLHSNWSYNSGIDVEDDIGGRHLPAFHGVDLGKKVVYFVTLKEWRQRQLNKLLDE